MNEKTKPVLEQLNFRVPPEYKRRLKAIAATQGVSVQDLGEIIIKTYFGEGGETTVKRERATANWNALAASGGEPQTPSTAVLGSSRAFATPMHCNEYPVRLVPHCNVVLPLPGGRADSSPTVGPAALPVAA